MTFSQAPFFTDGADHSAGLVRQMVAALIAAGEGVVGSTSCQVFENFIADDKVRITDGPIVIRGRVQPWQGNYADYNVGDTLASVPATGASPRNDLLVIRVEDPEFEGTLDPDVDNIIYPHLISNVPAGAETLEDAGEGGMSAVPLFRIEIPDSTATITNDMLVDVRKLGNARTQFFQDSIQSTLGSGATEAQASTSYADWPSFGNVTVNVPPWATRMDVSCTIFSIRYQANGGSGLATGTIRINAGSGTVIGNTDSGYNIDGGSATIGTAATMDAIPFQGGSVLLKTQAAKSDAGPQRAIATEFTSVVFQVFFREDPVWNP